LPQPEGEDSVVQEPADGLALDTLQRENDELRKRLADLFSAMGHEKLLLQERYERELQFAHSLQQAFLPEHSPEWEGLLLAARYLPALEVGGDFYDFMQLPDGRLGLLVGDVSGKGVPAALFMARFSSDFRSLAMGGASPAEAMSRANLDVCRRSRRGLFVTAVYVVIDAASGEMSISNAGHPVPLLRSASGHVRGLAEGIDIPLGIIKGTDYPQAQVKIESGETLLLMTDGAFDAKSPQGDRYGIDRLTGLLSGGDANPDVLIDHLLQEITRFKGDGPRSDDLTLVCAGRP
jgi:phosphoserine phosphatase RsbU/P